MKEGRNKCGEDERRMKHSYNPLARGINALKQQRSFQTEILYTEAIGRKGENDGERSGKTTD